MAIDRLVKFVESFGKVNKLFGRLFETLIRNGVGILGHHANDR